MNIRKKISMSRTNMYNSQKRIGMSLLIICFILGASSCSNDDDNEAQEEEQVDLLSIPGRYRGGFNNITFGTSGSLSMVVSPNNGDSYSVLIFETSNFRPSFNSDGVTPELIGTIDVMDTEASITLDLNTDSPVCNGEYTGTGARDMEGRFTFSITQIETCGGMDFESMGDWNFIKISNETTVP